MTRSRLAAAATIAAAIALVSTHTFTEFKGVRIKAVRQPIPSPSPTLRVPVDDRRLAQIHVPFALIARIDNTAGTAREFSLAIDGNPACARQVSGGTSRRIDCVVNAELRADGPHEVVVESGAAGWTLQYLEVATHHGGTVGANELIVLPASSRAFRRPGPVRLAILWLLTTALLLVPPPARPIRWLSVLHRVVAALLVAVLAACVVSQWVSPYRVIVSAKTLTAWFLIVMAPRLWQLGRWIVVPRAAEGRTPARLARAALVGLLTCAVYAAIVSDRLRTQYAGNYSGFIQISEQLYERNPLLNGRDDVRRSLVLQTGGGYDGQFMYFATFDPFLRAYHDRPAVYSDIMDAVPYRYGRIGFSLLTRVLSAGRWQRYPATMVWLILLSLGALGFLLAYLADERHLTPAWGVLAVAIPGFWVSLQACLPEPLAAAAFVAGVACLWRQRWALAAVLFAASLLIRETGVVAVAAVLVASASTGRSRRAALVAAAAFGVLVAWRLYVASILYPHWGAEALLFHPPDLGAPFAGIVDLWRTIAAGAYYPGVPGIARAGVAYPVLLLAAFGLATALVVLTPGAISVAAAFYALLAVSLNFSAIWVHVGNGQRGTYEVFLMLALASIALPVERRRLRTALLLFWVASACYVFFLGFDAMDVRGALPLPF